MNMQKNSKLTITLPSDYEIEMKRTFAAPRHLVYEAYSKPEHVKQWWGCNEMKMTVCEIDFRPGGAWRYVLRMPDGQEHPFKGVYQEIKAPEKLVFTFIYDVDLIRDHPAIETITFVEEQGKTTLTCNIRHKTKEARDGHLQSGMETGAAATFDNLEKLLSTML